MAIVLESRRQRLRYRRGSVDLRNVLVPGSNSRCPDDQPTESGRTENEFDRFNYGSDPSTGWANDRVFPYRKETANETQFGYVWVTAWDTESESTEFKAAYLEILDAQDATQTGNQTWVVENGRFADAFRVVLQGKRVVIVNGPTVETLDALRPGLTGRQPETTPLQSRTTPRTTPTQAQTTTTTVPGFGVLVAIIGLAIALVVAHRRRG